MVDWKPIGQTTSDLLLSKQKMIERRWFQRLLRTFASSSLAMIWLSLPIVPAHGQELILTQQLHEMQMRGSPFTLIDVRSTEDFARQHIEGAMNIPATAVAKAGMLKSTEIVLYCRDARCPLGHEAAKSLIAGGYKSVKVLYGGMAEWQRQSYPVVPTAALTEAGKLAGGVAHPIAISPNELWADLRQHAAMKIVDFRPAQEYTAGHLEGAMNAPLETLKGSALGEIPEIIVYDRVPERSQRGAALLARAGVKVRELAGGVAAWSAAGYPLVSGAQGNP